MQLNPLSPNPSVRKKAQRNSYLYSALSLTSFFPPYALTFLLLLFAVQSLNSPLWQACYVLGTVLHIKVYELVCR